MKCDKCGTPINKIPMSGLSIFLPKAIDGVQCLKCGTYYRISSLADWGNFLFYNGGFIIVFFLGFSSNL